MNVCLGTRQQSCVWVMPCSRWGKGALGPLNEREAAVEREDDRGQSKKRVKNGGVEGTVSRGLRAFLPVCVNQQLTAAERVKKNIKMSTWNKRKGEIFYDRPKFSSVYTRTCLTWIVFSRRGLRICIESQITQMTPLASYHTSIMSIWNWYVNSPMSSLLTGCENHVAC